jgi:putative FmdB family regulatory protein
MPIYEYECTKCGNRFEQLEETTSPPRAACPKCGAKAKRLISGGAAILMKGSRAAGSDSCCGLTTPCDDPKRCCGT